MRATVTLLTDGKVTIPKAIRDELGVDRGDTLEIDVTKAEAEA